MGSSYGEKQLDTVWLVLQNIDRIPNKPLDNVKLDCLQEFVVENNINIMVLTELNTAWDCLHYASLVGAKCGSTHCRALFCAICNDTCAPNHVGLLQYRMHHPHPTNVEKQSLACIQTHMRPQHFTRCEKSS